MNSLTRLRPTFPSVSGNELQNWVPLMPHVHTRVLVLMTVPSLVVNPSASAVVINELRRISTPCFCM